MVVKDYSVAKRLYPNINICKRLLSKNECDVSIVNKGKKEVFTKKIANLLNDWLKTEIKEKIYSFTKTFEILIKFLSETCKL